MKKRYALLQAFIILSCCTVSHAQSSSGLDFVENKGQWGDSFLYAAELPGGNMLVTRTGFTYCYTSDSDMHRIADMREAGQDADSEEVRGHWYKVNLVGINPGFQYGGEAKRARYINYYHGSDSSRWKGHVGVYSGVMEEEVYDGIDMHLYSKGMSLKYDLIVKAGGDPGQIAMQYEGVSPVIDSSGNLRIVTGVNQVTEAKPYAYQVINDDTVEVPCHYALSNNTVSFVFPEGYDTTVALVIDPQLIFVTYSGAGPFSAGYFSFCSTYDKNGNFYAGGVPLRGIWIPDPLWPTTPGAFQENWTTIYEPMVCINKYDATGSNLLFSTYYGGGGPNDIPHAMVCNDQDELILAGSTGSFNLPVTPGCFDSTKSGGTDMFVAHFTEDGSSLIGATYIGGNLGNSINAIDIYSTSGFTNQNKISPVEITLDSSGNIWAVTNTSTIDFPVTGNAAQPMFGGGNCDGIALGLTADCSQMLYGTYLGGSNTDVAYCIRLNSAGNLVVCGGTRSSNFPITDGAYMGTPAGAGDWDGYATVINPVTGSILHSTYLGTDEDDQATNLQVDKNDNVYVLGRTFGNYPISDGVYNVPQGDIFIDKLAPDLSSSLLSTRMGYHQGGDTSFFPTAFLLDNCEHIYVLGLSFSTKVLNLNGALVTYQGYPLQGMPLTADAFQTAPAPFWFGVLNPDFESLLYGSYMGRAGAVSYDDLDQPYYFGGDHTHVGTYRLDPHGLLYQSICSGSLYYPGTTANSWSPYNQNSYISDGDTGVIGQDIVSFKFRFDLSGTDAGTITTDGNDSGCAPYTLQFSSLTYAAQTYHWDFGDGATSSAASPTHTYTTAGTYHVMLAVHNDTVICKNDDTTYKTITIFDPHVPDLISNDTLLCDSVNQVLLHVTLSNPGAFGNSYQWQSIGGGGGIIGANNLTAVVNPNIDTLYRITVWDTMPGFCGYSASDTIHIDYKPRKLSVSPEDTLICKGQGITMNTTGTNGYSYNWTPAAGVQLPTDQNPTIAPDTTTQYTVTASYPGCADTAQSITIRIDDPASSSFILLDDSICTGQYIRVLASIPDSTANSFRWGFGDGSYMDTDNISDTMRHAYDTAGNLVVTLLTHFRACPDSAYTDTIHVFPLPVVNLGGDTSICANGTPIALQNRYNNMEIRSMAWSTGATTPWLKVMEPGRYSLTVRTEPIGCSNTDEVEVKRDCYIDIPNVFSPNNDGVNDYFFPRQLLTKSLTQFKMQIFNRWGEIIFETTDINGRGWDGRFNNVDQPAGVYVYLIEATINNEREEHYQGNVTLVR